jgi:hypothetical protein
MGCWQCWQCVGSMAGEGLRAGGYWVITRKRYVLPPVK